MVTEPQVLAFVGARSGSKGVPDKNIKPLLEKPLMGWIIDAARQARHVNRVIVSTDSPKYQKIALGCGAEAPFLRPKELASDESTDVEFIRHALDWLEREEGYTPDIVLRLVATAPLQSPDDIDACIELLMHDPAASAAVVVAEARQHPEKALKLVPDGREGYHLVSYRYGSGASVNPLSRQRYEKAYFRANVIASRLTTIQTLNSLTGENVRHHTIPQDRAIDIDSPIDFFIAEQLLKRHMGQI